MMEFQELFSEVPKVRKLTINIDIKIKHKDSTVTSRAKLSMIVGTGIEKKRKEPTRFSRGMRRGRPKHAMKQIDMYIDHDRSVYRGLFGLTSARLGEWPCCLFPPFHSRWRAGRSLFSSGLCRYT